MFNSSKFCIIPEADDGNSIGHSVAINDKYLAISDFNRVIIYTPNDSGQWIRKKKILPPTNIVDRPLLKCVLVFGETLELHEDILLIGGSITLPIIKTEDPRERFKRLIKAYKPKRYAINLNTETEVKEIKVLVEKTTDLVKLNLLRNGNFKEIIIPHNGEERFAESIAVHQDWLIVGSPSKKKKGKAFVFNLNRLKDNPLKIEMEEENFGETVAISNSFAVANGSRKFWRQNTFFEESSPGKPQHTIIKNLKTGISTKINSYGYLSLSENILAVMRPGDYLGYYHPLLEVFKIDDNHLIKLIVKRQDMSSAWVQNNFLIIVKHIHDYSIPHQLPHSSVCIESICQKSFL